MRQKERREKRWLAGWPYVVAVWSKFLAYLLPSLFFLYDNKIHLAKMARLIFENLFLFFYVSHAVIQQKFFSFAISFIFHHPPPSFYFFLSFRSSFLHFSLLTIYLLLLVYFARFFFSSFQTYNFFFFSHLLVLSSTPTALLPLLYPAIPLARRKCLSTTWSQVTSCAFSRLNDFYNSHFPLIKYSISFAIIRNVFFYLKYHFQLRYILLTF